jgi:4-nitrophenyl phosphatase/phosphoglycolate phosphatase
MWHAEAKGMNPQAYLIGEVGICEELDLVGIPWVGGPEDKGKEIELTSGYMLEQDKDVSHAHPFLKAK